MRRATQLALLAAALGAPPLHASDPPHWSGKALSIDCGTACHTPHQAAGGGLTQAAANVTLCQSCHNPSGLAQALSLTDAEKAVPDMRGTSHAFGVPGINPASGAQAPLDGAMQLSVTGGNVVCSTDLTKILGCADGQTTVVQECGAKKCVKVLKDNGTVITCQ